MPDMTRFPVFPCWDRGTLFSIPEVGMLGLRRYSTEHYKCSVTCWSWTPSLVHDCGLILLTKVLKKSDISIANYEDFYILSSKLFSIRHSETALAELDCWLVL